MQRMSRSYPLQACEKLLMTTKHFTLQNQKDAQKNRSRFRRTQIPNTPFPVSSGIVSREVVIVLACQALDVTLE